ncbi:aldehyde dehydrogenase family protein [Mycolicibacterium helvum]|uniref:Aldehyde dehydrogenase n=1 Tax=Mycolicibacterium helvum TaxID=1534349 RepID=A0A7I7T8U9_9MYCO|nr:aldehyde dehydrogenase family protein [Mycolicibacterium helvum]BBY64921.1 aldehyde dehydrogenase [Mycolicibacterium helvum]
MEPVRNFIGGAWVEPLTTDSILRADPFTGKIHLELPVSTAADVDLAVKSAAAAQPNWAAMDLADRLEALNEFADALEDAAADLAAAESLEMGKPVDIGTQFVLAGIEVFRESLKDAATYPFDEEYGGNDEIRTFTRHAPVGVVALIVPWNFTVAGILLGLGPILAAGNTVVVKPSEKATPSAVRMLEQCALPVGVINLVVGDGRTGRALSENPDVALVNFTGSVGAGRQVAQATAPRLARAVLELGGKDAAIVDLGVDVENVAAQLTYAAFVNSGQICTSIERVYVVAGIADALITALVAEARRYVMGEKRSAGQISIGPMVDAAQRNIVRYHIEDARAKGAKILVGGEIPDVPGYYYPATVLTDVTSDMLVMHEETFGPVLPVQVVASFEEGLANAAESHFGLAATIFTNDVTHAEAAAQLPVGMVWINQWQGSGLVRMYEPARASGSGLTGGRAAYDAATRGVSVSIPKRLVPPLRLSAD